MQDSVIIFIVSIVFDNLSMDLSLQNNINLNSCILWLKLLKMSPVANIASFI